MEKVAVKKDVEWLEEHLPPRCKKPRAKVASGSVEVSLQSYTSEEAPVAFRILRWNGEVEKELRLADGACWEPVEGERGRSAAALVDHALRNNNPGAFLQYEDGSTLADDVYRYAARTLHAVEDCARELEESFVLVDGEAWRITKEPGYSVSAFGGGDACVSVDRTHRAGWNALQLTEAEAAAKKRAAPDGEVSILDRIEVLLPEAVRSDPRGDRLRDLAACAAVQAADAARRAAALAVKADAAREELEAYEAATKDAPWRARP